MKSKRINKCSSLKWRKKKEQVNIFDKIKCLIKFFLLELLKHIPYVFEIHIHYQNFFKSYL